jgi:hypothetical protein
LPLIGNAQLIKRSENVAFSTTFLPRGATFRLATAGCRSIRGEFWAMLKICSALRDNAKALLSANLASWAAGHARGDN